MKKQIADYVSYAFFLLVMGAACYLASLWSGNSLVYKILYEGL